MRKLVVFLAFAVAASGCAASSAFRKGQTAARVGDWDDAVAFFTTAVQKNPNSAEYKINLRRAQEEAAGAHVAKAKDLEAKDQLEAALAEYRRSLEFVSGDRIAQAKVSELERKIRERIEATRPKTPIEQLRSQARPQGAPPLLNPASREPIRLSFGQSSSLKDILNFIGTAAGINITYDQQYIDKAYSVTLDGVTVEEALNQVLTANGYYFKVTGPRTIIVIPDQPAKHQQYDDLVIKVFYISHADVTELNQLVNAVIRIPQMPIQPMMMPSKQSSTITVRATAPVMDVIERIIRANDKPRAEVLLDIEILEVDRARVKRYGINLSAYALNFVFSPEVAPAGAVTPGQTSASPPLFNVNTISNGVNTTDFYLGVPTAVVNFLESDNRTKTLAKPQLRGQEGQALTLNLGADVPVLQTVFGAPAAGGFATIPQSSYSYRPTGVNLAITPRVTYEGEVMLDLSVENSAIGGNIDVGGQSAPEFTSRKVHTWLRLREGEPSLLAGLLRQDNTNNRTGFPGLMHVPGIRQLFSNNDINQQDTDIVMLITPHIVRDHELTPADVGSIFIGPQSNVGLTGPPQLIAPQPEAAPGGGAPGSPTQPAGMQGQPNAPQPGVPGPPTASTGGVPAINPAAPAGTSPVPGQLPPTGGAATVPAGTTPPGTIPPVTTPPTVPPTTSTPPRDQPPGTTPPQPANPNQPPSTPAQIIVTPPGTTFQVAGGPYTVPVSINNAQRLSVVTLTLTYNPAILRVRTIQDGTFMRQGGVTATFTPRIDAAAGRVDISLARVNDQTGASGAGLLAALLFDAVAPGSTAIGVTGVASAPDGTAMQIVFSPVTITVR